MNPRLVAIGGPRRGAIFRLSNHPVSIGREPGCHVWIDDPGISRNHCVIEQDGGKLKIKDLESLNGTFVNGVPIRERFLSHGDRIEIAASQFLFLVREDDLESALDAVQMDDRAFSVPSTLRLRREDSLYLQLDRLLQNTPSAGRMARDLNALLRIGTAIAAERALESLQKKLLEQIFEIVPAERGAILLLGDGDDPPRHEAGDFVSVHGSDRSSEGAQSVSVNRPLVDRVLREGIALLSQDIPEEDDATAPRSMLSIPLVVLGQMVGVIYLETANPESRFDETHLQLLTALGGMAAGALESARRLERVETENRRLLAEIGLEHNMIGESTRMREVLQTIARVASTDSTVLLFGESGTGKELAARALHQNSPRRAKPFLAVNCTTLTENLLESELFGHEKGAFTGAVARQEGKLERANGGSVFLDEVGELPTALQAKLLRVLQEREFERIGGKHTIKVDVRFIAATNRDLKREVREGRFRQDLYYRLDVVSLTMPPLRERREDIPLLASYFVAKSSAKVKRRVRGVSAEARAALVRYDWPGNIRELENAIERAVVLGATEHILLEDLPDVVLETEPDATSTSSAFHGAIRALKRELVRKAMEEAGGNHVEGARRLGIHVTYLYKLIRNLGVELGR